jgi:5-methylthioadenosine/S-adenosylhomocysteine deaminase
MFNDMYFREGEVAGTVASMGIRAVLGEGFIDMNSDGLRERNIKSTMDTVTTIESLNHPLISTAISPHAVYTVSEEGLNWCRETADSLNLPLHIHLSETNDEVGMCREQHGMGPVEYLEGLGFFDNTVTAAHCVHLNDTELGILADRGVRISHNPVSNMKLSSGGPMRLTAMIKRGMNVSLGTDGAASNNSLDMFDTINTTGLLARHTWGPGAVSTMDIIKMATGGMPGSHSRINEMVREGMTADLILVDGKHHSMNPPNDIPSNIVYSASGGAVKYTIIGGAVVLDNGRVEGEYEIIKEARKAAEDLISKGEKNDG